MGLDFVEDVLDDHGHKEQDKQVYDLLGFTHHTLPVIPTSLLSVLLSVIVQVHSQRLDKNYIGLSAAITLLEQTPELKQMLKEAWEAEAFRKIRNLVILQANKSKNPWRRKPRRHLDDQATLAAWNIPFVGGADNLLSYTINVMNRNRGTLAYANFLPIVQSSGTGKSRTVHELARLVFTIPFNLRDESENEGFAYPPPDSRVREFFSRKLFDGLADLKFDDVRAAYLSFLGHLFSIVREDLTRNLQRQPSYGDLATAWRDHLEQQDAFGVTVRSSIYNSVVRAALDRKPQTGMTVDHIASLGEEADQAASSLVDTIDSLVEKKTDNGDVRVVLYFDEAHCLSKAQVSGDPADRNYYDALCSALTLLTKRPLFVITLSTNLNLARFSPSKRTHPSSRIHKGRDTLQAPYTELPFDCLVDQEPFIRPGEMTLAEVSHVGFMVKFGRPLFYTRWKSSGSLVSVCDDMISFARAKLTGKHNIHLRSNGDPEYSRRARLAALSTRLLLDFGPKREAAFEMEAQLVAENMRIAYSVPGHREYLKSGTPSEPILAEAAAQEMNEMKEPIPDILARFVEEGLIDKGERGELVMRLLLTEAYDSAARTCCNRDNVPLSFSRPVPVFDFLRALFGNTHFDSILRSHSDNDSNGETFEEQFKTAFVRFTHFARNGKDNQPTTHTAWAAIVRGMAVQCSRNQHMIDAMIPMVLWDGKLCEDIMSAILIQVKNKEDNETFTIRQERIGYGAGFFPSDRPGDHRPYITLVMQLGVQTKAYKAAPVADVPIAPLVVRAAEPPVYVTPSKSPVQTRPPGCMTSKHPRYPIHVIGCSKSVYEVVKDSKDEYAFLLSGRDILEEHPRQSPLSLAAVHRFKPVWSLGPDCYDWIDDPVLSRIPPSLEAPEEGIFSGADAVEGQDEECL